MKKIGVICIALSLVMGMVGCTGSGKGPWQSLTYHVTSSVMTEGCHFSLTRDESGNMYLSGYCYEDNTEHRAEEPKLISGETAAAIEAMALETAAKAKKKLFSVADGTQVTLTLGYSDGSEQRISLSVQQREQLRKLLQKELIGQ